MTNTTYTNLVKQALGAIDREVGELAKRTRLLTGVRKNLLALDRVANSFHPPSGASNGRRKAGRHKRRMSPEGRARIVQAQKARWRRYKAEKTQKG